MTLSKLNKVLATITDEMSMTGRVKVELPPEHFWDMVDQASANGYARPVDKDTVLLNLDREYIVKLGPKFSVYKVPTSGAM